MDWPISAIWSGKPPGLIVPSACTPYWRDYYLSDAPGPEDDLLWETPDHRWLRPVDHLGERYALEVPERWAFMRINLWGYPARVAPEHAPHPDEPPAYCGPPLELTGSYGWHLVLGKEKPGLSRARRRILEVLLERFPEGLKKANFPGQRITVNTLKAMRADPDYDLILGVPGTCAGGGFRLRSVDEIRRMLLRRAG